MHPCIHAYMHTSIHPSIHPCIHTYIHTHTHTHIWPKYICSDMGSTPTNTLGPWAEEAPENEFWACVAQCRKHCLVASLVAPKFESSDRFHHRRGVFGIAPSDADAISRKKLRQPCSGNLRQHICYMGDGECIPSMRASEVGSQLSRPRPHMTAPRRDFLAVIPGVGNMLMRGPFSDINRGWQLGPTAWMLWDSLPT